MKERLNPACRHGFEGNVWETSVRSSIWSYSLLLLWQNELCGGGIEVVGLPVRQSGGEVPASSVRDLQSAACGLRRAGDEVPAFSDRGLHSAVHGLQRAVELRRTTDGSADAGAAGALWMFCAPVKSRGRAVDIRYANEAGSKIWCP